MDSKFEADTKIADSARMYQMQKANFDMETNAKVSAYRSSGSTINDLAIEVIFFFVATASSPEIIFFQ